VETPQAFERRVGELRATANEVSTTRLFRKERSITLEDPPDCEDFTVKLGMGPSPLSFAAEEVSGGGGGGRSGREGAMTPRTLSLYNAIVPSSSRA
jgi:hypothetical protein